MESNHEMQQQFLANSSQLGCPGISGGSRAARSIDRLRAPCRLTIGGDDVPVLSELVLENCRLGRQRYRTRDQPKPSKEWSRTHVRDPDGLCIGQPDGRGQFADVEHLEEAVHEQVQQAARQFYGRTFAVYQQQWLAAHRGRYQPVCWRTRQFLTPWGQVARAGARMKSLRAFFVSCC